MSDHIDAHVLRKYQTVERIGKGVRPDMAAAHHHYLLISPFV